VTMAALYLAAQLLLHPTRWACTASAACSVVSFLLGSVLFFSGHESGFAIVLLSGLTGTTSYLVRRRPAAD
jgi:hypothetical protein